MRGLAGDQLLLTGSQACEHPPLQSGLFPRLPQSALSQKRDVDDDVDSGRRAQGAGATRADALAISTCEYGGPVLAGVAVGDNA